jgi:hypothetical protein
VRGSEDPALGSTVGYMYPRSSLQPFHSPQTHNRAGIMYHWVYQATPHLQVPQRSPQVSAVALTLATAPTILNRQSIHSIEDVCGNRTDVASSPADKYTRRFVTLRSLYTNISSNKTTPHIHCPACLFLLSRPVNSFISYHIYGYRPRLLRLRYRCEDREGRRIDGAKTCAYSDDDSFDRDIDLDAQLKFQARDAQDGINAVTTLVPGLCQV